MSFYNSKMLSPLVGKIFSTSFECIRGDLWGGANIGQHSGTSWIKRSAFLESFNNIIPKPTTLNSGHFWVPSLISVNNFTNLGQIATKLKFLLCFFKQVFFNWNQTRSFHLTVGSCSATFWEYKNIFWTIHAEMSLKKETNLWVVDAHFQAEG